MTMDYEGKGTLNLQEAVRDLDARLKVLEPKEKATVTERVDKMLGDVFSHAPAKSEWKPDPPKK